jgi:hypothetical protein
MNQSTSQHHSQKMPTSKAAANASPNTGDTRASAVDAFHAGLHGPFPFLMKPFDNPRHSCSVTTGGAAPSVVQTPTGANAVHSGGHKTHSKHHAITRPWATLPAHQAFKDSAAHRPCAGQCSDPLSRWQAEPMSQGPYHTVAGVSRLHENSSQGSSRNEAQRMMDAPSHISAAKGSSGVARE